MSGSRYSHQREIIYEQLSQSREHPSAEQIYQALKPKNPSLSLGTVYRNLNRLAEEGRAVRMPFSTDRYDGCTIPHPHFYCERCGRLYDLEFVLESNPEEAVKKLGYQVERFDMIFRGVCPQCQRSARGEES